MPFAIIREDITRIKADAIVNTANPKPVCGDGTDRAVYQAAGMEKLLAARREIGEIQVGQAAVTPAFALKANYILHTAGPLWQGGDHGEEEEVRLCYENCLKMASKLGCKSIAFPLISTGAYGFPKNLALQIAVSVFRSFLEREEMTIWLTVFDQESFELSGKLFADIDTYIDENYVEEKLAQEHGGHRFLWRKRQRFEEAQPQASAFAEPPVAAAASVSRHLAPKAGRRLEDVVAQVEETFQERLFRLIDQRGMTDVEVYKKANLDRKLFSKIRCDTGYQPKKITALALAIALELNLDETKDLLLRAGYALSPSSKFDLIIQYFIEQEIYDIYDINMALFKLEQPVLGSM